MDDAHGSENLLYLASDQAFVGIPAVYVELALALYASDDGMYREGEEESVRGVALLGTLSTLDEVISQT